MKPAPLANFLIPHSFARNLAESRWGRGGTSSDHTTRHGVFYFSCSGHGGYVVDAGALTPEERTEVEKIVTAEPIRILVQGDAVIGISNPFTHTRGIKYKTHLGPPEWQVHPVYLFEEDCDWAVLEHVTGIRTSWAKGREDKDPEAFVADLERRFEELVAAKRRREVDAIPQ